MGISGSNIGAGTHIYFFPEAFLIHILDYLFAHQGNKALTTPNVYSILEGVPSMA